MKKNKIKRYRLSDHLAVKLGLTLNKSRRYRLSKEQEGILLNLDTVIKKGSEPNESQVLSALKDDGTIMTIMEFCNAYNINFEDVKSYKLVTHTGVPYYNIQSQTIRNSSNDSDSLVELFDKKIAKYLDSEHTVKVDNTSKQEDSNSGMTTAHLVFTDTHVGMNPNAEGFSMYSETWDEGAILRRGSIMVEKFIQLATDADTILVSNLGDFADGLDRQTVRKGHELPQNMSNEQMFDVGVEFLYRIYKRLRQVFPNKPIVWYNVCNSNHSSSFDYFICQMFKGMVEKGNDILTRVVNSRKFIDHLVINKHIHIFTHGKDDKHLKFGFKYNLDDKGKAKINDYIKYKDLRGLVPHKPHFHKGDSHLYCVDKSEDFNFNSYMPFSPSSEWVQINFKPSRSGFSINIYNSSNESVVRHDFEFGLGSHDLI